MTKRASQIEYAMEAAFQPRRFIDYKASWDFVHGVEEVATQIKGLIDDGQAVAAVSLYETFIAASYEKAEEIDDSSGSFGMFVDDLFCDWVRARQAARANPEETAELLLTWMESDDYGFCHELERDLVKALNAKGLRAFAARVRARLDASAPDDRGSAGYPRRRWTAALKRVLAAQRDAGAYLALCEVTALLSKDCSVLAGIHQRRGDLEEALVWVERGLGLASEERFSSADYDLKKLQRELLPRLGRADEAIAAAWADFEHRPSTYTYETLLEIVPEEDRPAWHEKAMIAATGGELSSVIGLLVETGETERLATLIDEATDEQIELISHHATEPAAALLADKHPALAARVFRAMGLRIVNAKKSKYYEAALANLERARECYLAAGQAAQWEAVVAEVRREHGRKYSFMPGFERVAAGKPAREPRPSFLERARKRWPRGGRR